MYKNKLHDRNNLFGVQIAKIRKSMKPKISQKNLSLKLVELGLDIDKNAVQRIESGERFLTDIELGAFVQVLNLATDETFKNFNYEENIKPSEKD